MQAHTIETKEATNRAWAARDARMRTAAGWSHYTAQQRLRAERMVLGLEMVYSAKGIYVNPRQRYITVKVDSAQVKNAKLLALLEQDYTAEGIVKIVSAQGVLYRIPKAD